MACGRRQFMAAGMGLALAQAAQAAAKARFTALAFDAFPIFDPRPIAALAETLFPGRGPVLMDAWRVRQFEYTWLRSLSRRYVDFMRVTEDALVFAARAGKFDLTADSRRQLLAAWSALKPWPDVIPALNTLKARGVNLAFLTNFSPEMLRGCIQSAGIGGMFDHVLSTDAAGTYKPDPRAYQLGVDAFHKPKEQILFVAFAGWDAAGAKAFGYPTFWVNRSGLPAEELDAPADGVGANLDDLLRFLEV
jgi:2-haloacid dehalogenase